MYVFMNNIIVLDVACNKLISSLQDVAVFGFLHPNTQVEHDIT